MGVAGHRNGDRDWRCGLVQMRGEVLGRLSAFEDMRDERLRNGEGSP
jgi:hypothetical protein